LKILITGGSQGAKVFGDIVPLAIKLLSKKHRSSLLVTQQVVEKDLESVRQMYKKIGVDANVSTFFDDMDKQLKETQLFIGRSGSLTVNELFVVGRASILVPLPIAMEDHQFINASIIADAGAGWLMKQDIFTPENLAKRIKYFLENPEVLKIAGKNAKNLAVLHAGKSLADLVEREIL
jgi:UDP-N-acetylglucosamine--N-acetylmuramyl-(pentapeptide) pyrophosphoryl-undecaprenol N-acetylglucosamine transferase